MGAWQVWVDTGGTFTDCLARDPAGRLLRAKVPSHGCLRRRARPGQRPGEVELAASAEPAGLFIGCGLRRLGTEVAAEIVGHEPGGRLRLRADLAPRLAGEEICEVVFEEEAPVVAARLVTGTPRREPLPPMAVRLATTRGTNALLERRGAPVALFVTAGFADLLAIGSQQREELFTLRPSRPVPLYAAVVEVPGRLDAEGRELEPIALDLVRPAAAAILAQGVRAAAVAFLHSYRNPEHENACARLLLELGFDYVARSSELAPRIQIVPRAETAVVDAYLNEVVRGYLERVEKAFGAGTLQVMSSAGGLASANAFRAKDSVLSGPAGGLVGAAAAGAASGHRTLLAFDMGGTSTDVSRWSGEFEYRFETRVAGTRLYGPALAIETVAAGGGSICSFDGSQLRVGPESAGAEPGPACYGAGGPLTLTDVNLLLGLLAPERFGIPLEPAAAAARAGELSARVRAAGGQRLAREELLAGLRRIADERMAEAMRRVSIRRGYLPADHALLSFGGAGGQHACALAELLDIRTVLVPAEAGLLSALGLGAARLERFAERQVLALLADVVDQVPGWLEGLAEVAGGRLLAEGCRPHELVPRRAVASLRLVGQESTLEIEVGGPGADLETSFRARYRELYGYAAAERPLELEALRVIVATGAPSAPPVAVPPVRRAALAHRRRAWLAGTWREVPAFDRESLAPGDELDGPALIFEAHSATVVETGWCARVDGAAALVLTR